MEIWITELKFLFQSYVGTHTDNSINLFFTFWKWWLTGETTKKHALLAEITVDEITKLVSAAEKRSHACLPTLKTVSAILDFLDGDEGTSEIHDALQRLHEIGVHVCGKREKIESKICLNSQPQLYKSTHALEWRLGPNKNNF